jgi:hypothetical protein
MKTVFQYFILVGVSVLGILGILRLGQGLKAPASVGGVWSLQWANPVSVKSNCPSISFEAESPEILISQSGPAVVITLHDATQTTFSGRLSELTIDARAKRNPQLHLVASIDRQVEPDQLQGVLTSNQCAVAINFTGTRLEHLPSLTGVH